METTTNYLNDSVLRNNAIVKSYSFFRYQSLEYANLRRTKLIFTCNLSIVFRMKANANGISR